MSGFLADSLIPIITIIVLKTSEAECIASLIIALECAIIPAKSLMIDNSTLPTIVMKDTLLAMFSKSLSLVLCAGAVDSFFS